MPDRPGKALYGILVLAALLLPLAFFTGTSDNFIIKKTLFQIAVLIMTAILVWDGSIVIPSGFMVRALLVYWAAMALSLFKSSVLYVSVWEMFDLSVFVIFFMALGSMRLTEHKRLDFLRVCVFSGLLVGLYAVFQHAGLDPFYWKNDYSGRVHSTLGNPNFLSGYMVFLVPAAFSSAVYAKGYRRYLWSLTGLFFFYTILLTQTRGSIASCILALLISGAIFLFSGRRRFAAFFAGAAAVFILLIAVFWFSGGGLSERLSTTARQDDRAVEERVFKWQTAMEMIRDNPVLGVGIGNVKVMFSSYQSRVFRKMPVRLKGSSESEVHNEYLQVWAQGGTVGLAAFMLFLSAVFYTLIKALKQEEGRVSLVPAVFGGITGILLDSLSGFPLRIIPTSFLFWSSLGIVASSGPREPSSIRLPAGMRIAALILLIFFGLRFTLLEFISSRLVFLAGRTGSITEEERAGYYNLALSMDPVHSERAAYELGMLYVGMKDYDRAIASFQRSIFLRHYAEVYNDLGNCYYLKGDQEAAAYNWTAALKLGLPDEGARSRIKKNLSIIFKEDRNEQDPAGKSKGDTRFPG